MSKYRRTQPSDPGNLSTKNIFIYGGALILLILILFILLYKPDPVNRTTFCPEENINEYGLTAIIVDLSDPLSISQEEALKAEFASLTKPHVVVTREKPLQSLPSEHVPFGPG
mgnify:CR=1 FL=1